MDAVEYLKARARMINECPVNCHECPLHYTKNGRHINCEAFEREFPEEAVTIVEKWAKEHPLKTYTLDFFEKFPNALKCVNGLPHSCKRNIYGGECSHNCTDCWNSPMEET